MNYFQIGELYKIVLPEGVCGITLAKNKGFHNSGVYYYNDAITLHTTEVLLCLENNLKLSTKYNVFIGDVVFLYGKTRLYSIFSIADSEDIFSYYERI